MNVTTPTAFVASVADRLDEIARQARAAGGAHHNGTAKPISSLDIVVRAIRATVDAARPTTHPRCDAVEHENRNAITDPRWFLLWVACGEASTYNPDERSEQARLAGCLGMEFGGYADAGRVVSALACAAIRDRVRSLREQEAALAAEREQARAKIAELAPLQTQVAEVMQAAEQADAQRKAIADELLTRNQQLATERQVSAFLRTLTRDNPDAAEPAATASPQGAVALANPPRRVRVPGATGIYTTARGAYEIEWRDNTGRQRWKIIGDSFEDAVAARAERIAASEASDT